nr:hypothetical protein [Tanacetum cinerariifolium]
MPKVRKKSLRDFHKTHPSGSGTVTKIAPSAAKIKSSVTNEATCSKPMVLEVTKEVSSESSHQESDNGDDNSQSNKEKGSDSEHETDENESGSKSDQEENEEDVDDNEEEKDVEFVKTPSNSTDDKDETNVKDETNQFDDDEDVRPNEPINTDDGLIRKEGTNAKMINVQQGNENLEITLDQVVEEAHVALSTVAKKTEVPITISSRSSYLASKFLNFSNIPYTYAEIVSPIDVNVHYERSQKDKDKYEDPSAGSDRGLKKRKTSKDDEPTKGLKAKESKSSSSKGTKSQSNISVKYVYAEEPEFKVAESEMPQDQEENLGDDDEEPKIKVVSKCDWFTKPKQP